MENWVGLMFTVLIGFFVMLGALIVFLSKNNEKFVHFSISVAFGVILSLIVLELVPEILEIFNEKYKNFASIGLLILISTLGIMTLKIIDKFIPDHHGHDEGDSHSNYYHIGIISTIALVLHNIIEGMAIFSSLTSSLHLGLILSIGVGLHNIPLGMVITSTLYKATNSVKKTLVYIFIISISTFLGGLVMYFNSGILLNEMVLGVTLALTLGMLLHIVIFELLPHIIHNKNKLSNTLGILLGVVLMVISIFLE